MKDPGFMTRLSQLAAERGKDRGMKLLFLCFTESGADLICLLMEKLGLLGNQCEGYCPEKLLANCGEGEKLKPFTGSITEWVGERFGLTDGFVFVGATGIAVRAVAPFVKSKASDPAVVVLDDMGRFAIPLLSGHLGGANELAERIAGICGGQAVITTATDIHGKFAVDMFAKKQGLMISDLKKARAVSSAVLRGESIGFFSDFPVEGDLPKELALGQVWGENLWITMYEGKRKGIFSRALRLVPVLLILGIGCRKGIQRAAVEKAVTQVLEKQKLSERAVLACATIDLKKEEPGLLEFAENRTIKFFTYSAEALRREKGSVSPSAFVEEVTGVDNVCERAALACAGELGGGRLLVKKEAIDGVTIAVAVLDWKVKL